MGNDKREIHSLLAGCFLAIETALQGYPAVMSGKQTSESKLSLGHTRNIFENSNESIYKGLNIPCTPNSDRLTLNLKVVL